MTLFQDSIALLFHVLLGLINKTPITFIILSWNMRNRNQVSRRFNVRRRRHKTTIHLRLVIIRSIGSRRETERKSSYEDKHTLSVALAFCRRCLKVTLHVDRIMVSKEIVLSNVKKLCNSGAKL